MSFRRTRAARSQCIVVAACAACGLHLSASDVRADEARVWEIDLEGHLGGYNATENGGGMALSGAALLGHYGPAEAGGVCEAGTQFLGGSMTGCAGFAGVGYDLAPYVRLALLGELGRHWYHEMGSALFGPPGASGSLAYAGGRLGVLFRFGDVDRGWGYGGSDTRFALGAWLFMRDDFGRTTYTTTYYELFAPKPTVWTGGVGQRQIGLMLRIGIVFGGP